MTTWSDRVAVMAEAVAHWRSRIASPNVEKVDPRSSLGADDRVLPGMPASQLAWWGMCQGVEHLDATIHLGGVGHPPLPAAPFTLLRSGALGACQAVYILGPTARPVRVGHALQVAHLEHREVISLLEKLLASPHLVPEAQAHAAQTADLLRTTTARRDEIESLMQSYGVHRLTDTAMIAAAAELLHSEGILQLGMSTEWSLGSGSAHNRLLLTRLRGGEITRVGDQSYFLHSGNPDAVALAATQVFLTVNEAWRLWDLRRAV